mmetsp:Transcript_34622/g.99464  ORF Transcript_34622/g.99464 Transcript_34622/m.99464 type:complete len:200 (-) Transcript_34622:619-1218(-)
MEKCPPSSGSMDAALPRRPTNADWEFREGTTARSPLPPLISLTRKGGRRSSQSCRYARVLRTCRAHKMEGSHTAAGKRSHLCSMHQLPQVKRACRPRTAHKAIQSSPCRLGSSCLGASSLSVGSFSSWQPAPAAPPLAHQILFGTSPAAACTAWEPPSPGRSPSARPAPPAGAPSGPGRSPRASAPRAAAPTGSGRHRA